MYLPFMGFYSFLFIFQFLFLSSEGDYFVIVHSQNWHTTFLTIMLFGIYIFSAKLKQQNYIQFLKQIQYSKWLSCHVMCWAERICMIYSISASSTPVIELSFFSLSNSMEWFVRFTFSSKQYQIFQR